MLTSKEAKIPINLISVAKKTPGMTAGIVCANHDSSIDSAKKAVELDLISPVFIGDKNAIKDKAEQFKWDISSYEIINSVDDKEAAIAGAELARDNKIRIMIKGNLHTDVLMRTYLKKEFGLIEGKRLSHIWHMTLSENDKPLFITDGALNVAPRLDVKMHILKNVIDFANRINIPKPKVAILSGTEDPIESMPSSIEAREIMDRAIKENIEAYVHGPLALDNAISPEAAAIKNISNEVAGQADILLVPNLETGNSLSKIMVYFMGACAAGFIVGGKVPVVVTSRADSSSSRIASIAAAVISAQ
ncbi:MAG: bifunctional enoyl-CoA hydratase/phosphate acetyltransferase [Proteobacteria bacterium]|nr:bifunctional enoyl-CoA hydratase/phosphate acetyltransferase [Pelagibacterales bacterium]MDA0968154.1 bifunctional enoyl-CoA hydratase/phosphate acetyltransferase [Pseudomonadota bacterium]MDA1181745.1 bifunctional enoyl-CoA hydratase/phosphate acetyltransferase [Pseudomonadota bacterium]